MNAMTKIHENEHSKIQYDGQVNPRETTDALTGGPSAFSRRQFLEAAGFSISLAAVGGCGRAPVETALPFPIQPVGAEPGNLRNYASTCQGCPAACGLLVGTRDGRPLKMEGLPEHPLSRGGLCAVGQALPLGLYDSHRLKQPLYRGVPFERDQRFAGRLRSVGSSDRRGALRSHRTAASVTRIP